MPGSGAPKSAFPALCCIFFAAKGGPVLIRLALLCLVVSGLLANSNAQSGDWKQLFDGKDLVGWKHVGPGEMTVEDGLIRTHGGMGLLYWTGGKLGDCAIRVVYKMRDHNDNSGVFIRIPIEPREEWMPVHYGYEVQIDNQPEDSKEDEYHVTGTLYSLTKPLAKPGKPGPEWNTMEITLDGPRTIVALNGIKVTDYTEGEPVPERKFNFEPQRGTRPNDRYFPPFRRATRDGYAVRAADLAAVPTTLEVVAEAKAGGALVPPIVSGQAVSIMTGAPVPDGADAIVMVELTSRAGNRVEVQRTINPGDNIVPVGAEGKKGDVMLAPGMRLDYAAIGV